MSYDKMVKQVPIDIYKKRKFLAPQIQVLNIDLKPLVLYPLLGISELSISIVSVRYGSVSILYGWVYTDLQFL